MANIKDPCIARWYASTKHAAQKYGLQPYSFHLQAAVTELNNCLRLPAFRYYDHDLIYCATWLHDVVEDTGTSLNELGELFDQRVVELVAAVTDGEGTNRYERKAGVYAKIRKVGLPALAVKLADRLANSMACGLPKEKSSMLDMYQKEEAKFEEELRIPELKCDDLEVVWKLLRCYLGLVG